MAKDLYDGPLTKDMDFTNPVGDGRPASGLAVQNYIKEIDSNSQDCGESIEALEDDVETLNSSKFGIGYTEDGGAKHLFFATQEDLDEYIADPTKTYLIKDTIELEPLYYMNVTPISELYNTVFLGDKGNFIEYTFETVNRNGFVVSESVTVTYTISHAGTSQVVTQMYGPGTTVHFNVDNYILEGTNNISVEIKGQQTKVGTSFSTVYQVVNLVLTDTMNIATVYRINDGDINLQVPYSVSGVGQKTMEWYIDGERVQINPQDDIISDTTSSRTKYIDIVGLPQGRHFLQFRVGINVNGTTYYSSVRYREFIVSLGQAGDPIIVTATDFPTDAPILGQYDPLVITLTQYETFPLRVAVFNPSGQYQNEVIASVNGTTLANIMCTTGEESRVSLTLTQEGSGTLVLTTGSYEREIDIDVEETELDIHEIDGDLVLNFTAEGKSNDSDDKNVWHDRGGTYNAELFGFDWTNVSGWVNNRLIIPSGAHIDFDLRPLTPNPSFEGKTIELDFKTINVENDNATLINLINSNTGAGIKLTATGIQVKSKDGRVDMNRRYKTDEDMRLSIVINRSSGSLLARLAQVYFNGILSMTQEFEETDNFTCLNYLSVGGEGAGMILKQIRIYDTALDADSIVNNYILYQPTVNDMLEVYERNDLYENGLTSFDLDKIAAYLPVMILTGDMEPINTAVDNKATTIMDVEYTNLQNPTYSFRAVNTQMRPQGTSSLTYPRKNLRLYLNKRDDTELYDYEGNPVPRVGGKLLYSFKPKAQPVDCWTLKADFAESSSTHNTGVARIWNDVMKQTQVNGENVLRTHAQQCAIDNGYPYDVRTTVDGFPIVIFWHRYASDPLTFLGKYNFNNDKSTESVFGFKDIPGFDNSHVNCWEFRDSGYNLALFKTPSNGRTYEEEFDYYASNVDAKGNWIFNQVWESRYPDYNKPDADVSQLKRLALWINSTEGAAVIDDNPAHTTYGQLIVGDQSKFEEWQAHKTDYFDLPKLAAYYIYLMRFGGVDQTVKNAMMTTEDGEHWYFINYDNDTILGVRNDGILAYGPEINRQSKDAGGSWVYAGHESVLWNNFEVDPECMAMVRTIDSALVGGGLTYAEMIKMFNEEQAGKWAEKVYNKDAMYKYIEPWLYDDQKYLGSLQGSRSDHRKWWISNRFANYDALYANSTYTSTAIHFLIPDAPPTSTFTIEAGRDFYYGWGQNRVPVEIGIPVANGQSHTFQLEGGMDEWQVGTPLIIYAPYYIKTLNVSNLLPYLYTNFDISDAWSDTLGSKMKSLIIGVDDPLTDARRGRSEFSDISGLPKIVTLENLNIAGCSGIKSIDLSTLVNLKTFKAQASGLTSARFANGAPLNHIELPISLSALTLNSLPALRTDGIIFEPDYEDNQKQGKNITNISIHGCPYITNSPDLILNWLDNKVNEDELCSVSLDNVYWELISHEDLTKICEFKRNGGHLDISGVATLESIGSEAFATYLRNTFIDEFDVFNPTSKFYIMSDPEIFIDGPTSLLEGETATYTAIVIGGDVGGTTTFQITSGKTARESLDPQTGVLTTTEIPSQSGDDTLTIRAVYVVHGQMYEPATTTVRVLKRIYPSGDSQVQLIGSSDIVPGISNTYTIDYTVEGITGDMTATWSLTDDLLTNAEFVERTNTSCTIVIPGTVSQEVISGNVDLVLKRTVDSYTIAHKTKQVTYVDQTIAVSRATNPYVMDVMYNNGLCADPNKMTKTEAGLVTPSQLQPNPSSSSASIFYSNSNFRTKCYSFPEFKWFIGIGELPDYLFYNCVLEYIELPSSCIKIGKYSLYLNPPKRQSTAQDIDLTNITEFAGNPSIYVNNRSSSSSQWVRNYNAIILGSNVEYYGDRNSYGTGTMISWQDTPTASTSKLVVKGAINMNAKVYTGMQFSENGTQTNLLDNVDVVLTSEDLIGVGSFFSGSGIKSFSILHNFSSQQTATQNNGFTLKNCSNLTTVDLRNWTNLQTITRQGNTDVNEGIFSNCTSLQTVYLPSSVTNLHPHTFYNCSSLTNFTWPRNCQIMQDIFGGCINLTNIDFSEAVSNNCPRSIDKGALKDTAITSFEVPVTVSSIGGCFIPNATTLTVAGGNTHFSCTNNTIWTTDSYSGHNYLYIHATCKGAMVNGIYQAPVLSASAYDYRINSYAFAYINVPFKLDDQFQNNITNISERAFYNSGITEFKMSPKIADLGAGILYGCQNCSDIIWPEDGLINPYRNRYCFIEGSYITKFDTRDMPGLNYGADSIFSNTVFKTPTKYAHVVTSPTNGVYSNISSTTGDVKKITIIQTETDRSYNYQLATGNQYIEEIELIGKGSYSGQSLGNLPNLKKVTFPERMQQFARIGPGATGTTPGTLTYVFKSQTPPTVTRSDFLHNDTSKRYTIQIYVPYGCGNAYKAASNWSNHASQIHELPQNYGTFGGLILAPAPLYYGNTGFMINHSDWKHESYGDIYGKNIGSYYFSYLDLGSYFDSDGANFDANSGSIDNANTLTYDGYSDWRIPTQDEWQIIVGRESHSTGSLRRTGSTINSVSGCCYTVCRVTDVQFGTSTNGVYGLLLAPDGLDITLSKTLTWNSVYVSNNDITDDQLEDYIIAGCIFLPSNGAYYRTSRGQWQGASAVTYTWASDESTSSTDRGNAIGITSTGEQWNAASYTDKVNYCLTRLIRGTANV